MRYRLTKLGESIGGFLLKSDGTLAPHNPKSIEAFALLGWIEVAKSRFGVTIRQMEEYDVHVNAASQDEADAIVYKMIGDVALDSGPFPTIEIRDVRADCELTFINKSLCIVK